MAEKGRYHGEVACGYISRKVKRATALAVWLLLNATRPLGRQLCHCLKYIGTARRGGGPADLFNRV